MSDQQQQQQQPRRALVWGRTLLEAHGLARSYGLDPTDRRAVLLMSGDSPTSRWAGLDPRGFDLYGITLEECAVAVGYPATFWTELAS